MSGLRVGIVGGGIAGLATAWGLRRRGAQVTLFEQGPIPNPLAASGDRHRIIRRGYAGQDGYARTIEDAFAAWGELWRDTGADGLEETGVLCVSQFPGDEGADYIAGYDRLGVAYDALDGRAAAERYPFLDADGVDRAAFVADGGVLACETIAAALSAWLAREGCALHPHTAVETVDRETATVRAGGKDHRFDAVVIAAGAWTPRLLPDLNLERHLTPHRTIVAYLAPPPDLERAWAEAPALLSVGGTDVDGYVVPPVRGLGLKVGAGITKVAGDPDSDWSPGIAAGEKLRDAFAPPFARIADYAVEEVRTCVYTFTADETFFGDCDGKAFIVSACSGHGYKFGAAVGLRTADAVLSGDVAGWQRWLRAEV
ncbi:MAG: FAD-dependent oxidoreductase [Pseudomonadota bacterium]